VLGDMQPIPALTVLAAGVSAYHLGPGRSLSAKLEEAVAALERGRVNAASGHLKAFANAVEAHAGKQLTRELAGFLANSAQQIRAVIGR
jgi:hypothetical protein